MDNIIEILKQSRYQDKPMYNGRYLFPYTGDIHDDWQIFSQAIDILATVKEFGVDDYFYWLDFAEKIFVDTSTKGSSGPLLDKITLGGSLNFILTGAVGSLVPGYGLIFPREHVLSMSNLSDEAKIEYIDYLSQVRKLFENAFGKSPIIFEHGSNTLDMPKSNSINHAHTHIVNHQFLNESAILRDLRMRELSSFEELLEQGIDKNYISYVSADNRFFYTDECNHESQIMRKYISQDLGDEEIWDWRKYPLYENLFETAKGITLQRIRNVDK